MNIQSTGDAAGIAIMIIVGGSFLVSAAVWAVDCHRARNRPPAKRESCAEDVALDRLAAEVDRHLEERVRRREPITDPTLDPIQTLNLNSPHRRRAFDGGGWPV